MLGAVHRAGKRCSSDGNTIFHAAIDMCSQDNGGCATHAACTQLGVNVSCTCAAGYWGDGYVCEPIDRCADGRNGDCSEHAHCISTGPVSTAHRQGQHPCHADPTPTVLRPAQWGQAPSGVVLGPFLPPHLPNRHRVCHSHGISGLLVVGWSFRDREGHLQRNTAAQCGAGGARPVNHVPHPCSSAVLEAICATLWGFPRSWMQGWNRGRWPMEATHSAAVLHSCGSTPGPQECSSSAAACTMANTVPPLLQNKRRCECKRGYIGDGIQCLEEAVPPTDRCLDSNGQCHREAICTDLHFHGEHPQGHRWVQAGVAQGGRCADALCLHFADKTMGVFHLQSPRKKYDFTYVQAQEACAAEGAALATFQQLAAAQQVGSSGGNGPRSVRLAGGSPCCWALPQPSSGLRHLPFARPTQQWVWGSCGASHSHKTEPQR